MGSIRVSCVGDLLPADTAYTLGNGIGSNMARLIEHYSGHENNPFNNSDIVFCNLEAPLILNPGNSKLPFEGNPAVIQLMKTLGITVVSVANNHILDHGPDGFVQTIRSLDENGFSLTGPKQEGISKIAWLELKGKKFALAAFNAINDHPENKLIAPLERDMLFNTLDEIKNQSPDYTIFSFHWGNEYVTYPSPLQVDLAHELIDNGVNVIIGHHPHVVQPVEEYHGGVILYSLGNFLFDMFWSEKVRNGMQVDLIFNEDKSIEYQIKPFRIRSDFTYDYTKTEVVSSILSKAGKTMERLRSGPGETWHREYTHESGKSRLQARYNMKIYLLKNMFKLSPQSRALFFRNIKMKSRSLWKSN